MNINYNYNFLCTYTDFSNNYYSNLCYQIQLLQAFNMQKYDEFILNKNIQSMFVLLKDNLEIKNILLLLSKKITNLSFLNIFNKEEQIYLNYQLLFSYDYFYIFHKCFSNYLKHNNINNINNNNNNKYFENLYLYIERM